ncbi:hypothetical protein [Salinispora mooreana]|uniref:hypothetical protein n=1 Tax=Salinispora mooreana TaxID=999545 RepID=UPI0003626263|nr:hypothetical protein [Salinispora mooreana]
MNLIDAIVDVISPHATDCHGIDCSSCADAVSRADLILATLADWLTEPGRDWRAGLALAEACAGCADGIDPDRAVNAVLVELAAAIRPTAPPGRRPTLADRYAELPDGGPS